MRLMIAVPCMDMVHTLFFRSFAGLRLPAGTEVVISTSSLIYDARNQLARKAVEGGYDRVLWLDSDMVFDPDMAERFMADLDGGLEYVSGLFFSRRAPVRLCAYDVCGVKVSDDEGHVPTVHSFEKLPDAPVFEVAASGLAAVCMSTDLIARIAERFGLPFSPVMGFGEDLSFCMRARELGARLWCDSRIRLGHVGQAIFDYNVWPGRDAHG